MFSIVPAKSTGLFYIEDYIKPCTYLKIAKMFLVLTSNVTVEPKIFNLNREEYNNRNVFKKIERKNVKF
jgi:hypothetical protein